MLQPCPAGASDELFPSPAKSHYDNPGLSSAHGADVQALVDAALGGYYTRGETNDLLAARATTQQLNDALAGKHPLLTSESALAVDILSARGLAVGSFVGIGTPTPQAALDVVEAYWDLRAFALATSTSLNDSSTTRQAWKPSPPR